MATNLRKLMLALASVVSFCLISDCSVLIAQDLIQPPQGFVKYQLSNIRMERGIGGDLIAFDYKRVGEGKGSVVLAARTDNGPVRISGFGARIEQAGTIRLRDIFSRLRGVLGANDGIEFYFVARDGSAYVPSGKRYLVSNSIKHGKMNSAVLARPLNQKELAEIERQRLISTPPSTVPAGYTLVTKETKLVAGAPVMVGSMGKWKEATVVGFPSSRLVKVMEPGKKTLRRVLREKWIAISNQTAQRIAQDPSQFSISIRTLPDGDLILDDDLEPVTDAMSLLKGTPLRFEKHTRWQDGYFLGSDNVSVHLAVNQYGQTKREMVPRNRVAIRKQTISDLQRDNAEELFAANIASLPKAESIAGASRGTGSLDSGMNSGAASFPEPTMTQPSTGASEKIDSNEAERTWSDTSGKFKIVAKLTRKTATHVFLERADGRVVQVPIDRLSDADKDYLNPSANANPFEEVILSGGPSSSMDMAVPAVGALDYSNVMQPVTRISDLRWGAKSVAVSPDNQYLLIGRAAESASLCEVKTGKMLVDSGRMPHMGDVTQVAFTPNSEFALLGGYKGVIDVYAFNKGKLKMAKQYAGHTSEITAMSISVDSRRALTGDRDKGVRFWDIASGETLANITGLNRRVQATHISANGRTLMATDGKTLLVYDTASGSVIRKLELMRGIGQSSAFSPNGLVLAAGDSYKIHLWNLQEFSQMPSLEAGSIAWTSVFAPDSRHLLTGHNGQFYIWDTKTQSRILAQPVGQSFYIKGIGISADGTHISCPSDHSSVVVLKTK